jgi:hypothetical protein
VTTPALAKNVRGKGRHYEHPNTGDLVPSVTNVIGVLDKPALPRWAAKMVAETAYRMRNSLAEMDEAEAVDMLKGAPWSKATRAADRGTDIHAYLEARVNGWTPEPLSGEAVRYKRAADDWFEAYRPELVASELTVFHPKYAGTGDLWCRIDGRMTVLDFKTSKAIYSEAALQLAALWGAFTTADGGPVPHAGEQTDLLVVRIGEDKFEVKQVADPQASFEAFLALVTAWEWKHGVAYVEDIR